MTKLDWEKRNKAIRVVCRAIEDARKCGESFAPTPLTEPTRTRHANSKKPTARQVVVNLVSQFGVTADEFQRALCLVVLHAADFGDVTLAERLVRKVPCWIFPPEITLAWLSKNGPITIEYQEPNNSDECDRCWNSHPPFHLKLCREKREQLECNIKQLGRAAVAGRLRRTKLDFSSEAEIDIHCLRSIN